MLTKHKALLGRGAWAESRRVGNPGRWLCHVACNLGFYGEGVARALLSQNECQQKGSVEVVGHRTHGHTASPLKFLPVGGGLLVLCSLPGPPVVK